MKHHIKNIIFMAIGAFILSFGLNYFIIPNQLGEGGFTGISLLLKYIFGWPPALTILFLNIPLFIIGWHKLGKNSMIYTIIGTLFVSLFLELTKEFQLVLDDLLLASLYAGASVGIGLGIIFRVGGTTGGVDIIARLFFKYYNLSIGKTMFIFDAIVIAVSATHIGKERAMYTLIAVFLGARVIDFVQEGVYAAKAATIISEHAPEIASKILNEMNRGATLLKGRGGYTGSEKEVLYCVVNRIELTRLKRLIYTIDKRAFVVVNDVHDVLGEGFEK